MHGQDSDGVYEAFYLIIEMYFPSVKGFRPSAMASNGHLWPFCQQYSCPRVGPMWLYSKDFRNKKNLFYPLNAFQKYFVIETHVLDHPQVGPLRRDTTPTVWSNIKNLINLRKSSLLS